MLLLCIIGISSRAGLRSKETRVLDSLLECNENRKRERNLSVHQEWVKCWTNTHFGRKKRNGREDEGVGLEGVGNENGRGAAGGGSRDFVFRSWEWEGRARV